MLPSGRIAFLAAAALGLLVCGRVVQLRGDQAAETNVSRHLPVFENCDAPTDWSADWRPEFQGADIELSLTQRCDGLTTHVYVLEYVGAREGREAVNVLNAIYPRAHRSKAQEAIVTSGALTVLQSDLTHSDPPILVWSWYAVGGRSAATGLGTKLLEAWSAIRLRATVTRVLLVVVDAQERERATRVLAACSHQLDRWVGEAS
jgi:hypothetical protein